jgi:hypothetical protein
MLPAFVGRLGIKIEYAQLFFDLILHCVDAIFVDLLFSA